MRAGPSLAQRCVLVFGRMGGLSVDCNLLVVRVVFF